MKIDYIRKRFNAATLDSIEQANQIIDEYMDDGLTLTLRQLYYQFVSRDLIANKQSEYKRLGKIISNARLSGWIDWDSIEDRTRSLKSITHWWNPGHIIGAVSSNFAMDHWVGQEYRPEVWIEKEALVGVIADICRNLDIAYFACKGYVSQSELWKAANRLNDYEMEGQKPVIIHLGDHDPSGLDMTRDIIDRLNTFSCYPEVERIALNMNQINTYDPPPNPAKLTDTRANDYISEYGNSSWELDALEPRVIGDLIRQTVLKLRDDTVLQDVLAQERIYKAELVELQGKWDAR